MDKVYWYPILGVLNIITLLGNCSILYFNVLGNLLILPILHDLLYCNVLKFSSFPSFHPLPAAVACVQTHFCTTNVHARSIKSSRVLLCSYSPAIWCISSSHSSVENSMYSKQVKCTCTAPPPIWYFLEIKESEYNKLGVLWNIYMCIRTFKSWFVRMMLAKHIN